MLSPVHDSSPSPSSANACVPAARSAPRPQRSRWIATLLSASAGLLFVLSYWQPFWTFKLYAPQYPRGLSLIIYLTGFAGDAREIDMLNHYIGMAALEHGAPLERSLAHYAIALVALSVLGCALQGSRRAALWAAAIGVAFPVGFLLDTFYWLYAFGHHLDKRAPLRIDAFTPQLFGNGTIGQFMTFATPGLGFWLVVVGAAVLVGVAALRVWESGSWHRS